MLPNRRSHPIKSALPAVLALCAVLPAGAAGAFTTAAATTPAATAPTATTPATVTPAGLPQLTIAAQTCHTGPTPADRWLLVAATAIRPARSPRVALRFRLQQQVTSKRWQTLIAPTLGAWETSKPGRSGLQITKRIDALSQSVTYRMLIQARGADNHKRATTRSVQTVVPCQQIPAAATLKINPLGVVNRPGEGLLISARISNLGQAASAPFAFTATSANGVVLGTTTVDALPGQASRVVQLPVTQCVGVVTLTVAQTGTVPDATDAQATTTLTCPSAGSASQG